MLVTAEPYLIFFVGDEVWLVVESFPKMRLLEQAIAKINRAKVYPCLNGREGYLTALESDAIQALWGSSDFIRISCSGKR